MIREWLIHRMQPVPQNPLKKPVPFYLPDSLRPQPLANISSQQLFDNVSGISINFGFVSIRPLDFVADDVVFDLADFCGVERRVAEQQFEYQDSERPPVDCLGVNDGGVGSCLGGHVVGGAQPRPDRVLFPLLRCLRVVLEIDRLCLLFRQIFPDLVFFELASLLEVKVVDGCQKNFLFLVDAIFFR